MNRFIKIARVPAARAVFGLAAVLLAGVALDRRHRPVWIGPDHIEHAAGAWLLLSLAFVAFPKVRVWVLAAVFVGLGAGVEFAQWAAGGDAELTDLAADAAGVAIACAGVLVARLRDRASTMGDGGRPRPFGRFWSTPPRPGSR